MHNKNIPKLRFPEFTDEWEQRKLGELYATIGNAFVGTATPYYADHGHFYLESNNVKDGQINHNSEIFINDEFYEKQKDKWLHTGDMVMVQSGHVGHAAVIPEELDKTAAHALIMFRNPKTDIEPYFLNYQYQTDKSKNKIESITTGNTIKHILASDMQNFVVDVPKYEEQVRIGKYFRNLDHLITLHQRKCDSLKELRNGIIQRIFSKELRFKRADGREFENWVTKELSEIFTERKVSQTITEDAPLLSFTIEQGVINPQDKKTNKRDFLIKDKDTKKFALTEVDDIIYNPANLKYGAIHRNKLMRGVVSPIYAIFYTEQNPAFMGYVVKNPAFIKNSMKYLEGTVIKLMTLKPRDFLKLKVEIPASLEEQKIIADFLMKFDETIDAEQKKIEKWKELKKGLLQQMFV